MKLALSMLALSWLQGCPTWAARIFDPLASTSFGIFFLHFYVVYLARDIRRLLDASWSGTFVSVASYTMVVVGVSAGVAWALRKTIGARSRYLIGC